MLKNNLFSFLGHIGICILCAILLALMSKLGQVGLYLEFTVTLAACSSYFYLGSRLKEQSGMVTSITSTCTVSIVNVLLWLLSFSQTFGAYKVLSLDDLPFSRYSVFLAFNSPFIPAADLTTRYTIAENSLYEFIFLILALLPQAIIMLGLMWGRISVGKKICLLGCTGAVVALVIFLPSIIYSPASRENEAISGNTDGNLANGGEICIQGDSIYYSVMRRTFILPYNVFCRSSLNGRHVKVLTNNDAGYINICGELIYFVDMLDYKGYRMRIDGSGLSPLSEDNMTYLLAVGDTIYFRNESDGGKLYRINSDGKNKTMVSPDTANNILYRDGFLYYCNDVGLCRIKTDGSDKKTLCEGKIRSAVIDENTIYFIDQGKNSSLYSIGLDGSDKRYLNICNAGSFNVSDKTLAYIPANSYYGFLYIRNSLDGSFIEDYPHFISVSVYSIEDSYFYLH